MKTRFGWLVGVGLFLGCATAAPPQQAPSATAPSATAPSTSKSTLAQGTGTVAEDPRDPDKTLVCEDVKITGSRIPKRVCRTLRQVQAEREQAEKMMRDGSRVIPPAEM